MTQYFRILKIAISIAFIFTLSYLLYNRIKPGIDSQEVISQKETITRSNPKGQKSTIFLGDGSEVILNAHSSITYTLPFDETQREVKLVGEAFFEVAKDNRPFKVAADEIITVALGTSFNIKAYRGHQVKVSLATGNVGVYQSNGEGAYSNFHLLDPGEQLSFSRETGYTKTQFDQDEVFAWKDGIIYFKSADASTVFTKLEQWYGVKIETVNETVRVWHVNASFDNKSLEHVLNTLSYSEQFEYSINKNHILIKY